MRLVKLLVIILLFCASDASSQVSLPKYYYFDTPADTVGWSHYSLLGADDWEWGDPTGVYLNSVYSSPFLWCTNLQGFFTANSVMVLETPSFDFSDTTDYAISFQHAYNTQSNHGGNIEYSVSGGPWILLGGSLSDKHNWYNVSNVSILSQPAWSGNNYLSFKYSAHKLNFLTGNSDVRFRFKFGGSTNPRDGWSIDNLRIVEDVTDVIANVGDSIIASKYSPNFVVNSQAGYSAIVPVTFNNVTKYYFSTDLVYDTSDIYLGSKSALFNATVNNWTQTFSMVPGLNVGTYYILYQHDADSLVTEPSEINNWSYAVLKIDSTYGLPRQFDFSDGFQGWKREGPVLWEIGPGISHHAEGVHSDSNAVNIYKGNNTTCYIESPFFDLTSANNPIMSFWMNSSSTGYVKYSVNNGLNWPTLATFGASPQDDWFNFSVNLDSTYQNIKFRIYGETVVIDDIYLGTSFPDLSIEKDKFNRFTSTQQATYTLNYSFFNSGLVYAISTETEFYWSNDSILDSGDIFLGSNTDPAINSNTVVNGSFTVNKPILTPGKYYIFYKIDGQNSIVENREYDNTGFFILYQNDAITAPYINDFETQIDGWRHGSTLGGDDWEWGVPQGIFLDTAFSGTKAIITNADGWVTPMSRMHFYTPIFDFTSWLNPVIEFDMKNYCLGGLVQWNHLSSNMSYSIDGGANWVVLDTISNSYNKWYYETRFRDYSGIDENDYNPESAETLFEPTERIFANSTQYNGRDTKRTTRYILDIGNLISNDEVQFRFNLSSVEFDTTLSWILEHEFEGMLIDDFKVRESFIDLSVDYEKSLMLSSLTNRVDFFMDIYNHGNYISSSTDVNFYLSSDTVLDGSDEFIGIDTIPEIRPDMGYYLSTGHSVIGNITDYTYLIYEIDPNNNITESNESNIIGIWNLSLDSINTYPYLQTFGDSVVDGWNSKIINVLNRDWRFRNMTAPMEYLYQTQIVSGVMFLDQISSSTNLNTVPYCYLYSPAFDFSEVSQIQMTFDMFIESKVSSGYHDGANIQFSLDGGNSWQILIAQFGDNFNWYNFQFLEDMQNEPGWAKAAMFSVGNPITFDSVYFDISFLKLQPSVLFKYKFYSRSGNDGYPKGLRIDDFRIDANSYDYISNDHGVVINADVVFPDFPVTYSISNLSEATLINTNTRFYWSTDSIWDAGDPLVTTVIEPPIPVSGTVNGNINISYPIPLVQSTYYLFYEADGDYDIGEMSETNNLGMFKVVFNYTNSIITEDGSTITTYSDGNYLYFKSEVVLASEPLFFKIYDVQGKVICNDKLSISNGINSYKLPNNISSGIYIVDLNYNDEKISLKINIGYKKN